MNIFHFAQFCAFHHTELFKDKFPWFWLALVTGGILVVIMLTLLMP